MTISNSPLIKKGRAFVLRNERRNLSFTVLRGIWEQIKGAGVVSVRANNSNISSPKIALQENEERSLAASGVREFPRKTKGAPFLISAAIASAETGCMVNMGTARSSSKESSSPSQCAVFSSAVSAVKSAARTRSGRSSARCSISLSLSSFSRLERLRRLCRPYVKRKTSPPVENAKRVAAAIEIPMPTLK